MSEYNYAHYMIAHGLIGILPLSIGLFVFKRNNKNSLYQVFLAYNACISWWGICTVLMQLAPNASVALAWDRLELLAIAFIPTTFLHFTLSFLKQAHKRKQLVTIGYLISASFAALSLTSAMAEKVSKKQYIPYFTDPGPLYPVFLIFFTCVMSVALIFSFKAYRNENGREQKRANLWFFVAALIATIGGSGNFLVPYDLVVPVLVPYGSYGIVIYVLITGYLIIRHRFLDIDVLIKRTLVFAGLFTLLMASVASASLISQTVLGEYFNIHPIVAMALGVTIAIALYDPVRNRLIDATDKYLFQRRINYKYLLRLATKGLSKINSQKHQLDLIVRYLVMRVRIKAVSIYIYDDRRMKYVLSAWHPRDGKVIRPEHIDCQSEIAEYLKKERRKPQLEYYEVEELAQRQKARDQYLLRYEFNKIFTHMKELSAFLILPSYYRDSLQGFLVMGEKSSEELYREEEIELLNTLAQETALSIENSRVHDALVEKSQQLEDANDELKRAQEQVINVKQEAAVAGLSGGISHEVKNYILPLTAGIEMVRMSFQEGIEEIIKADHKPGTIAPELRKKLLTLFKEGMEGGDQAEACAESIDSVARTLNQMAKGKEAEMTRVSLKTFLNWMIKGGILRTYGDRIRSQALEEPVQLTFGKELPGVRAHAGLMRAVFLNLFKNAIHAIKDIPHPRIAVHAEIAPDDPKMVEITFSDNGCGIAPEILPHIFDYEFTTKGKEGEGKGLYNVKNIIDEHKGTIDVKSELGKGTTFTIRLCKWEDPSMKLWTR